MNAIAYRKGVLIFTALFTGFFTYNWWTGSPNVFRLFFGKDSSPLEAIGFRYGACILLFMVLQCLVSLWGSDQERKRFLRIATPVWVALVLISLSNKQVFVPIWWNVLTSSFLIGTVLSYVGGFVLSNERVAIHVHKHIVPDPAVIDEASKAHQA